MVILIKKAKTAVGQMIHSIQRKVEYLRERLECMLGIYRVDTQHVYSPEENRLIEKSSELIRQFFPGPPGSTLLTEDFESRCEVIEDFAHQLIQIYGLENVEVIVTDDPELFSSDGGVVFGRTRIDQKTVYINANLLRLDNVDVLEHLVGTVIHELRHIMQFEIMILVNTRGVSYQRRKAWRYTMANYVDAGLDMEAYSTQSIEFDARNFTNRIWQRAYGMSVPLGGH